MHVALHRTQACCFASYAGMLCCVACCGAAEGDASSRCTLHCLPCATSSEVLSHVHRVKGCVGFTVRGGVTCLALKFGSTHEPRCWGVLGVAAGGLRNRSARMHDLMCIVVRSAAQHNSYVMLCRAASACCCPAGFFLGTAAVCPSSAIANVL